MRVESARGQAAVGSTPLARGAGASAQAGSGRGGAARIAGRHHRRPRVVLEPVLAVLRDRGVCPPAHHGRSRASGGPRAREYLRANWFNAPTAARPDFLLPVSKLAAPHPQVAAVEATPALAPSPYQEDDAELATRARNVATSLLGLARVYDAPAAILLMAASSVPSSMR